MLLGSYAPWHLGSWKGNPAPPDCCVATKLATFLIFSPAELGAVVCLLCSSPHHTCATMQGAGLPRLTSKTYYYCTTLDVLFKVLPSNSSPARRANPKRTTLAQQANSERLFCNAVHLQATVTATCQVCKPGLLWNSVVGLESHHLGITPLPNLNTWPKGIIFTEYQGDRAMDQNGTLHQRNIDIAKSSTWRLRRRIWHADFAKFFAASR